MLGTIRSLAGKISSKPFLKIGATLVTGTMLSQAITVGMIPFLTRLYTPEAFGELAIFVSVSMLLGVFATLKYELAIILPESNVDALGIVKLGAIISCLTGLFFFILLWFVKIFIFDINSTFFFFIPINTTILGVTSCCQNYLYRIKSYNVNSIMAVFQSLILLACNLVFHRIFENQGMIISAIVCNLIVFIVYFLYVNYKYNFFEITSTIKRLEIKKYFYDYIEFPKIVLWSEFLLIFIQQAPNALIAPIYSKSSVGFFSLVFRVLRIPTMVIGNAVGAVFMNEAIDQYRGKSEFSGLFKKSLKMLGIMGFIFFLFVGLFSPWVFEFVLGPNWGQAGKMAQLMSPLFFLDFISWPLMSIYIITKSFKLGLLVRLLTAISIPITIYAGYFFYKDIYKSILFFQISLIIFTILHIVLTYYLSKGKKIFFDNN